MDNGSSGGIGDGLILLGAGMGVVFAVLAILAWMSGLLNRLFGEKSKEKPAPAAEEPLAVVPEQVPESPSGDVVAAIALALSLAQAESGKPASIKVAGVTRMATGSPWAVYGRQQIMDSRGRSKKKW